MQIQGKVVVVTGGANGIGRALCKAFAAEGARAVVVADLDEKGAQQVAAEIKGVAMPTNVGKEADVKRLVENTTAQFGKVDIFCSNAGIATQGGPEAPDVEWQRIWEINVMAHIYASRAVLPQMLARKEGYLVQTVSAAGLLMQIGSAPYSVTKHAAMSFAEYLAVTYGEQGVRVSALCPQGVRTNMLLNAEFGGGAFLMEGALEPEQVAGEVMKAIVEERFLILPHPEVAKFFQNKANDYERWLRGMRKLQAKMTPLKASQ
ncbi:MAG TPA: SDR family oxidoreductase [Candidatus Angelobacter sp.]|nr:SDR family oxidoreductase [Candidatus Angelobacter sp.]